MSCSCQSLILNKKKTYQKPLICFCIGIFSYLAFLFLKKFGIVEKQLLLPISLIILFLLGYHVILEGVIETYKNSKQNKKFTPNIDILMTLAALGSLFLKDYDEAILLILIFSGASFLEKYVENKSQKEIKNLLQLRPLEARLLKEDGITEIISSNNLKIKDLLLILQGDAIPTDGIIVSGNPYIDESNITGEAIPCEKKPGDLVYGSTINGNNTFVMRVLTTNEKTVFAQIVKLVTQTNNNFSKTATFIKKIEPIYVKIIMVIVALVLTIGGINYFFDSRDLSSFKKLFVSTMVFLTVSSPCALAASDIPSTLAAISNLAKKGVLFKNVKSLEIIADTKAFACDKTGTLTEGKPEVTDVYVDPNISQENYENYLEILLGMEQKSNHPLASAINNYFNPTSYLPLEITNLVGIGIETFYQNNYYRISKAVIVETVSKDLENQTKIFLSQGKTVIYFSSNNQVIIALAFLDKVRLQAIHLIDYFNKKNIYTAVISGDNHQSSLFLKQQLNLKKAWGNNLPVQKVKKIQELQKKYGTTIMVGDGVNDAPALRAANIGIAMQNGTDVSIDVADAILMKNDLSKIIYTHKIALKLNKIIWQNIIFAMSVVLILNLINLVRPIPLPLPWAVFCHEGSTLLVILNGLRLLKSDKDFIKN
ncbi:zinc-transporting P-type ATPase [Candidatus Phytoplasma solani]|uniref:heavy metal translocating P-type ATPase n=1 Tax=Candidatus Phytoplasma solani TaxID=69896 RepID=UPI0032D9E5A3